MASIRLLLQIAFLHDLLIHHMDVKSAYLMELVLTTKKGVLYKGKKKWNSLLGEKYLWRKPIHFSVKNTVNNANSWGFVQ